MSPPPAPKWPSRAAQANRLSTVLASFAESRRPLPGVASEAARTTLVMQMVASIRRLEYTEILLKRSIDLARADPGNGHFDPERAAILHMQAGRIDEAAWLVFLATHFGKHPRHGWRMLQDVYSGLGTRPWTWERVSRSPAAFRVWLTKHNRKIGGSFGNHRKYESINGDRPGGTGAVVESYVAWVGPTRSHRQRFADLIRESGNDPNAIFEHFYRAMVVARFGRLGKFDFLCMLGRIGLAPILPGRAYLKGATGPLRGARLLFGGDPEAQLQEPFLEALLIDLDGDLQVGMQVIEDSLCNWQKSPTSFIHFKG
jgi:hypothetical protein